MNRTLLIIFFVFISSTTPARADVMLLIHGYLGDANSWEKSGINDSLQQKGWYRAGMFRGTPNGPQLFLTDSKNAKNLVYVATLPSNTAIPVQSDILKIIIEKIQKRHPDEKIILVGHSAGGIVARMALIRHQLKNITALITIASPHLGTSRAEQAINITNNHGPFNMVKNVVGGNNYYALEQSRELLLDLRHPQPGNMLFWLNKQTHPDIRYASIIRISEKGIAGDFYVPGFSQDMNNVPALHEKSAIFTTPTSHFLQKKDALAIITILKKWQQ